MSSSLIAFLAVVVLSAPAPQQGKIKPPKGPAPRFVTVQEVDADKGELIMSEECHSHPAVESRVITKKQENRREEGHSLEIGSDAKPRIYYYTTIHKVPLKKLTLYRADGKKLADTEFSRLKPGDMVLMSADGHPVEAEYLNLIKPETLILVVEVGAVPSVFESTESSDGMIKNLKK
jgi:hypothetical protein